MTDSNNELIQLPYKFNPRPYQLEFFQALENPKYKRFFLRWCRRSGKDKTCLAAIASLLWRRMESCFYLFPSYSQGKKAIWDNVDKNNNMKMLDHIPEALRANVVNNEMKMTLKNGSTFRVMGTEDIDSLVGTNPSIIVFSEWALHQSVKVWELLRPILEENNGIVIFNGTPRGQNHAFEMEYRNKGRDSWYFSTVQTLWEDKENYYPVMSKEQMNNILEEGGDHALIEQEYGVSYIAGEKGRYYSENIKQARLQGRVGAFPHNPQQYVDVIFDLGYTDDTTMGFKQMDGKKHTWIDYYENNTKDIKHYVDYMKQKDYSYRYVVLPHDAEGGKFQTGLSHREMFENLLDQANIRAEVIIAPKVHKKIDGIQAVRNVFHSYFFNEDTTREMLAKLELYCRKWDKNKQCFLEAPDHANSHCADMVSYDALTRDDQEYSSVWGSVMRDSNISMNYDPFDDDLW